MSKLEQLDILCNPVDGTGCNTPPLSAPILSESGGMPHTLNILVIGHFQEEAFGLHISETLRGMGNKVYTLDPFSQVPLGNISYMPRIGSIGKVRNLLARQVISHDSYAKSLCHTIKKKMRGDRCDLVISTHDFLSPTSLACIRKEFGACLTLWFPDHLARFERSFMASGLYDHLFFKDPFIVRRFRSELGIKNTHYLPECCSPTQHYYPEDKKVTPTINLGTAGGYHPPRASVFQRLVKEGHEIVLWGPPITSWMRPLGKGVQSRGYAANHDKVRAFRSCKIVLNTTQPAEVEGTNVRTFEIAATGSFQLVNHRSCLADLFHLEKELITFDDLEDLVDKVAYYLPRDEERARISAAAQKRALSQHTYEIRLNTLLRTAFLGK